MNGCSSDLGNPDAGTRLKYVDTYVFEVERVSRQLQPLLNTHRWCHYVRDPQPCASTPIFTTPTPDNTVDRVTPSPSPSPGPSPVTQQLWAGVVHANQLTRDQGPDER